MNIKKTMSIIIAFIISFVATQPMNNYTNLLSASAETEVSPTSITDGDLKYKVYSDHAVLSYCNRNAEGEIIISKKINNVPVTHIASSAFRDCNKISSITIPDSVISIGISAFENCKKLSSVKIPESVTDIGYNAFNNTLLLMKLQEANPLVIINDILIDGKECSGDIEIPKNVKIIGDKAFYSCDKITSIIIPEGVIKVGTSAFENCSNLTSIAIPDGVVRVGNSAFENCSNLSSIKIPDSVVSIGTFAFSNTPWLVNLLNDDPLIIINHILVAVKTDLETIEIPNDVTIIGDGAFYKSSIKSVIIPDGVKSIGNRAFEESNLKYITIPESVTNINERAFFTCKSLSFITIKNKECVIYDDSLTICSSYSPALDGTSKMKGSFGGTIEGNANSTAQTYAQKHKYRFSEINDKEFTDIIEDGLKYRKYNDHVEVVGVITPPEELSIKSNISGIPVTTIRNLGSSLIKSIILPSTVNYIDNKAISSCSSLQSITITNKECKIYDSSLTICNSAPITGKVNGETIYKGSFSGLIYCYEGSTAQAYAEKYGFKYEVFEEEVYHDITQDSVIYRIYSDHAKIIGCSSDNVKGELIIPTTIENVSVTEIKSSAFYMCDKITTIKLPDTITIISDFAFEKCTNLETVYFPDNNISIGKSSFSDCAKLTNVTLNNGLKHIGESAFSGCSNISSLIIPDTVLNIDKSAFERCTKLESIKILNRDCEINDASETICNSIYYAPIGMGSNKGNFSGTIYGYKGSTAKQYAFFNDYKFEELPEVPETTTTSLASTTTTATTTTQKSTTSTTVPNQNQQNYPLGDVNNDGQINAVDASTVLSYYAMISTNKDGGFDENQMAAADVNHDGQINAVDASCILSYYAYVSTTKEEILSLEAFLKK